MALLRRIAACSVRSAVRLPVRLSHAIAQHRNTPENNAETPFEWTQASLKEIPRIMAKYPKNYKQSAVMPLLTLAQEQDNNWLSLAKMNKVAEMLDMPPIRVYEVATFYSQYNREPVGKFHLQVCGTTPCMLCGSEKLMKAIEKHLGIKAGETTKDGLFTVTEAECLGACANAPMIQINNHEYYENLTEETLIKLLDDLKDGRPVKAGPQNGVQRVAEGPMGRTTLKDPESIQPVCRDLDAVRKEAEKAAEAAAAAAASAKAASAAPQKS